MGPGADDSKTATLEACHKNFIGAFEGVAGLVPGGVAERLGGLTAVRTGMPGPSFNVIFGLSRPTSLKELREGIDRLFIRTRTQFQMVTTHETMDSLKPIIDENSLMDRTDIPGMILDQLPDSTPDCPKGLEIRLVSELQEVSQYLRTGAAGFGIRDDYFDVWAAGVVAGAADQSSPQANYLGYFKGKPVATSLLYTARHLAGIYFVSTLPEFRRRGFGEAMTWRAVTDGRKRGCRASYLQASPMGRPVYERMGYRLVEEYQEWRTRGP